MEFNPWRGACGFYPPDIVSALGSFCVVATRRKFSDLHKRAYEQLVRRAGKNGECFPSQERIAADCGNKPLRTIRRVLDDLEHFGLIGRQRRGRGVGGRGQTDDYQFFLHPIFDRPKPLVLTGQNEHFNRPKWTAPYKEEFRQELSTGKARSFEPLTSEEMQHPAARPYLREHGPFRSRCERAESPERYQAAVIRRAIAEYEQSLPAKPARPQFSDPKVQEVADYYLARYGELPDGWQEIALGDSEAQRVS